MFKIEKQTDLHHEVVAFIRKKYILTLSLLLNVARIKILHTREEATRKRDRIHG